MSSLFEGPPSIPKPIVPAPAPQKSDAEVMGDANAERRRLAGAAGRASTILTGTDASAQPSGAKTLLGSNS